jgi:hypothetical protein
MQIITSTVREAGTNAERLALTPASATAVFFWETDTKYAWFWDTVNWIRLSISGAALVTTAREGVFQQGEVANPLSGTRNTVYFPGALSVYINYFQSGATATGKVLLVVFNAVDDTDADAKNASGFRTCVSLGKEFEKLFSLNNRCVRMDIYSDAATESGATAYYEGVSL